MKRVETIEVINLLIIINNNRIEGYEMALRTTNEIDLKALFAEFILTSRKCNNQLVEQVELLKEETGKTKTKRRRFFRAWKDVKTALTGKNRQAILKSCEFGEDIALEEYEKTINNQLEYLNSPLHSIVNAQKSELKRDRDHIKSLRKALVDE